MGTSPEGHIWPIPPGSLISLLLKENMIVFSLCHVLKKVGKPCFRGLLEGKGECLGGLCSCHFLHFRVVVKEREADSSLWT